ncbi:MAG: HIT domain-containing protein [Bacilli bacterium]|nr:HIT domain-containing protein [Bacilli bacterium]
MDNCIFCKIVKGDIPSYTIYEDEIVKCFLDINPVNDGHALIIPKKHYTNLDDIDLDTLNHIMKVAKDIKKKLDEKLNMGGLRLFQNNGSVQEVKHFHLHLVPSNGNDIELITNTNKKDVKEVFDLLK